MKKVLLIDSDPIRGQELSAKLSEGGLEIQVASGGFYALTMMEREAPDLVLVRSELDDMSGWEFSTIARRDPSLTQVQLIHLSNGGEGAMGADPASPFDLVVAADAESGAMAKRIIQLLLTVSTVEVVLPRSPAAEKTGLSREMNLMGVLEELTFVELTQILSEARKSGLLTLDLKGRIGLVVYQEGKVRHASYQSRQGYEAFVTVFLHSRDSRDGSFQFEALNVEELALFPRTINAFAQQLLSNIQIDVYGTAELSLTGDGTDEPSREDS